MSQAPAQSTANTPARAARDETPQYKLQTEAYIGDRICREGQVIYYRGIPAWYMTPVNEAARKMIDKHKPKNLDPIKELQVVGPSSNPSTR